MRIVYFILPMNLYIYLFFLASIVCINVQASKSPNFIFILTDDQGWNSLSSAIDPRFPNAKSDFHKTPNMDKLLKMGANFTNAYASSPVCAPSRYSIQFGKSPARLHKTIVRGVNKVDHDQIGIAQLLKKINKDYYCAHFGKWHIDQTPSRYGYDVHDGITKNKEGNFHHDNSRKQWGGYAEEDPKRINSLTNKTIDFIKDSLNQERPFFVQLSHYAVHSDIVYSSESFSEMLLEMPGSTHDNIAYAAMIMDLDKSIGQILDAYESLDLNENTYIIFTSDNGGMPVIPLQVNRGRPYKKGLNDPLVRGKWDLMEGGIRVPFAIAGPNIKSRLISHTPVVGYDLFPTIVDLAGPKINNLDIPNDLDGGTLVQILNGDDSAKVKRNTQGIVFHFPHYNVCGLNEPHSAFRTENFKLVEFYTSKRKLLFDMRTDISEINDLSEERPDLVAQMSRTLNEYLSSVEAEVPEESFSWKKVGQGGSVKTLFFKRYD